MLTYYRSPEILITSDTYERRTSPACVLRIRDLRSVGILRGGRRAKGSGGPAAVLVLAAAVVGWAIVHSPVILLVGLPLAAVAALSGLRRGEVWELRATYRNMQVVLFRSADRQVFGQVTRSLRRALEAAAA
jgi:hypothetical protein